MLFYIHEDEEGYEDESMTRFRRPIALDVKKEDLVNDRVVLFAKYKKIGFNWCVDQSKDFLERIARKTPKQLVEMFEVSDFWSSSCDFDNNYCLVKFSPCTLHVKRRESH